MEMEKSTETLMSEKRIEAGIYMISTSIDIDRTTFENMEGNYQSLNSFKTLFIKEFGEKSTYVCYKLSEFTTNLNDDYVNTDMWWIYIVIS